MNKTLCNSLLALAVCAGACTLSGCAAGPYTTTVAAAAGLRPTEVAILSVVAADKTKGREVAMIHRVYDDGGRDLLNPDGGSRGTDRVTVPPGQYQLMLHVFGGYNELDAYPRLRVRVEAGKTYDVAAVRVMDGRAVRAVYREAGAGMAYE